MTGPKPSSATALPAIRSASLAMLAGVAVLGAGLQRAEADIVISSSRDGKDITVDVTNEIGKAVVDKLASHFGLKVSGVIDDGKPVNARVRGDLASVMNGLFGERNVMIVYGAKGPEELVIISGSASARPAVNETALVTAPMPAKRADTAGIAAKAAVTPAAPSMSRTVVVSGVSADQIRPLLPRMAVRDQSDGEEGTAPPPGHGGEDAAALNRRSAEMLGSLVQALKALCPTGNKC